MVSRAYKQVKSRGYRFLTSPLAFNLYLAHFFHNIVQIFSLKLKEFFLPTKTIRLIVQINIICEIFHGNQRSNILNTILHNQMDLGGGTPPPPSPLISPICYNPDQSLILTRKIPLFTHSHTYCLTGLQTSLHLSYFSIHCLMHSHCYFGPLVTLFPSKDVKEFEPVVGH